MGDSPPLPTTKMTNKKDFDLGTDWLSPDMLVLRWHDGDPPTEEDPGFPPGWRWSGWGRGLHTDYEPWIVIDLINSSRYRVAAVDYSSVAVGDALRDKKTHDSFESAVADLKDRAMAWL